MITHFVFRDDPQEYLSLLEEEIKAAKAEVAELKNSTDTSFEGLIIPLEKAWSRPSSIGGIIHSVNSACTSPALQVVTQKASAMLSIYGNDISLDNDLFRLIKQVHDGEALHDEEDRRLMRKIYRSFVRNGALLGEDDKETLRRIDMDLSQKTLKFGENLLADVNEFILHVTDERRLGGLSKPLLGQARHEASSRDLAGWVFTLQYPSFVPFMMFADDRDLRKQIFMSFSTKGLRGNANDNQLLIKDIVRLRNERIKLLGYERYTDYVLEERMADSHDKVLGFLDELFKSSEQAYRKEFEELEAFAKEEHGLDRLEKWDVSYYSEKLKQKKFDLSEEVLKPYFEVGRVTKGVFEVATKLYGIRFEKLSDISVYHQDVDVYQVLDEDGSFLALFYVDFFARSNKKDGAWMTAFSQQYRDGYEDRRPSISIVCNFPVPSDDHPSLLSFQDVQTLFHEFGHALHGILSKCKYQSLSGTSVSWDFVELPSQIMENWCFEEDCLSLFARHYETDEVIPMDLVQKVKDSANFRAASQTVRQLSLGYLDMAFHSSPPEEIDDVIEFEREIMRPFGLLPEVEGTGMSGSFSHIFQGGYASGYYSYKWAEVLDADAFERFKEEGVFNKQVAREFRTLLESGDKKDPMELFKAFRKRDPDVKALVRRTGLAVS